MPSRHLPKSAYLRLSDRRFVVLRRILSIHTESSSMSLAWVGLTEPVRECNSPDDDGRPDTSRNSKPRFDGDSGGDGVDDADRGKLSGWCQAECRCVESVVAALELLECPA